MKNIDDSGISTYLLIMPLSIWPCSLFLPVSLDKTCTTLIFSSPSVISLISARNMMSSFLLFPHISVNLCLLDTLFA